MATPISDRNTLINTSGCYSGQTLSQNDQQAIEILLMAEELAAIGGTNYVGALSTTLMVDSDCFVTLELDETIRVRLQILNNNATSAGASPGTINAQIAAAACLRNSSKAQLQAAKTFLLAQLGQSKNYPQ